MHSSAVTLWKTGGSNISEALRRTADKSRDFLSFWAALENNFGASEDSDVLLTGIKRFRDKVNMCAENGVIKIEDLTAIVLELEESAETDEELKYWRSFELPEDVEFVTLEELGSAVYDYLAEDSNKNEHVEEILSPVAAEAHNILPILRQIKDDVAVLKAKSAVKIKTNQLESSSRNSSTFSTAPDDFLLSDRLFSTKSRKEKKPWKVCPCQLQNCLMQ